MDPQSDPGRPPDPADWTERLLACYQRALGHELPNHLMAIQGLLQILHLEEADRLSPEGRDYVRRAVAASQRTHQLVKALAELGRAGREPPEAVALLEVAGEVTAEINQLFPRQNVAYHFPPGGLVLTLPRNSLRQVLTHLFRNAAQAAVPERPLRIELGIREGPGEVAFWVADNGCGIPASRQQQLFEPFAGRDASRPGNGLGLVLVRRLVESWGGTLQVQSEPGEGSRFSVTVPR